MASSTRRLCSLQRTLATSQRVPFRALLVPALFSPSPIRLMSTTPVRTADVVDSRPPTSGTARAAPSATSQHGSASPTTMPPSDSHNDNNKANTGRRKPLTQAQRDFLSSALRVNQAGELAATLIYTGQTPPLVRRAPHLRPLLRHMHAQEAGHLATFNALLARHRVRPTAMYPAWAALSYGLGWATAVAGREAAMACTEAVETEIGDHYNGQIRALLEMVAAWEAEGYEAGGELHALIATLRRIRDEELEHLDHAVEHDAKKAEPHWLLTGIIRMGCRGAIWVTEKV